MASEDLKIIIKQKGTIPVWTKTKVGTDSSVDVDGVTIVKDSTGKISAIATIDQNSGQPLYDWVGTMQEFIDQDVANEHPDWLCFITDDGGVVDGIYTAAQCDALFARIADVYTRSQANELFATKANANNVYTKAEIDTIESGKANIDASNFTTTGTTFLSTLSLPDFARYDNLTILASGNTYTAPANGWFYAKGQTNSANTPAVIYLHGPLIDGRQSTLGSWAPLGATDRVACCIYPVTTGTSVEFVYGNNTTNLMLVFIYAEGNPGGQ